MEIKDLIREKRQELGLTYEQLGNLIGVGKSTVRKWETGMIENMRRDNIIALSKALNISPAILMGWNVNDLSDKDTTNLNYSKEEQQHIEDLRKLNDMGKKKVITYTKDLIEMPKYIKEAESDYLAPIAAHDDNLTDEEKAVMDQKINEYLKKHK
ncbi:helix-turn-helix family protein [Clostridium baratii str. Sullivan]|uniref:Helix-turn-helix family protein n=1 Tax=Clostridium baratii str. Sullivan TaxID=1415775 RepID=A0A0A7FYY2_9CLOT|nr:helix-turn-helix transcriptional regulator [Clostridium baratii]AIY84081.1 helix-turn-helix family protein [Clostridium baratii str. Sullivan]